MILNDYFTLNSVFALVCLASDCRTSESVKTEKATHTVIGENLRQDSSFWPCKVRADIHAASIEKRR